MPYFRLRIATVVALFVFLTTGCAQSQPEDREAPRMSPREPRSRTPGVAPQGFEQVIPRGAIRAINNPLYVTGKRARIRDESFVLGIVVEGTPLAFSLNLLNQHEIVNDSVGKTNFSAVW